MSAVALSPRELDDLLLQLKGLVHVRALLENRGASAAEIEEHTAEIDRVRTQLAELVSESGEGGKTGEAGLPFAGRTSR